MKRRPKRRPKTKREFIVLFATLIPFVFSSLVSSYFYSNLGFRGLAISQDWHGLDLTEAASALFWLPFAWFFFTLWKRCIIYFKILPEERAHRLH